MRAVPDQPHTWSALNPELRASWHRSAQFLQDPGTALAPVELGDADLDAYRSEHPLRLVFPIFDRLLRQPAADAGLIIGIGDASGRLLWVDGDRSTLRRAETSAFQPGALWSEEAIGTSAPGMALATNRGVQVHQEEHFAYTVHQFSCSAAPIHNPHNGELLGVVDLTGDERAVATHALPLIYAAVSAAEAELKVLPLDTASPQLITLGTRYPQLRNAAAAGALSLRHAEILTLLAWQQHRRGEGLTAAELSERLYGATGHEVTLRVEMSRLRRMLADMPTPRQLELHSKPYRLSHEVELDALRVVQTLTSGDRSSALDAYGGELLPESEAPGILALRHQLSTLLRETILSDGSGDEIWRYLQLSESASDEQVIYTALDVLPAESPRRAALVARMQR